MEKDKKEEFGMKKIPVIHHDMMDQRIFNTVLPIGQTVIRTFNYPFTNLTAKMQAQKGLKMYSSFWDCIKKTHQQEGFRGFYNGGAVRILGYIPSSLAYINTLEYTKFHLLKLFPGHDYVCAAGAGFSASFSAQLLGCPIELVSQILILNGEKAPKNVIKGKKIQTLDIPETVKHQRGLTKVYSICTVIYKQRGFLGFWKGYLASVAQFGTSSAIWWPLYFFLSDCLYSIPLLENNLPLLGIKSLAAILGGCCTSMITNPVDLIRLRLQMQKESFIPVVIEVWKENGCRIFTKALTPRMMSSISFSFFAILGYETSKYLSLKEEHSIPL